jgi:predicted acetyltransferase
MTQSSNQNGSRLDRLEALAETILLATQQQQNLITANAEQSEEQQQQSEERQQQFEERQRQFGEGMEQLRQRFEDIAQQQEANAEQIAANSQQIASNTAGLIELRNILADFICRYG